MKLHNKYQKQGFQAVFVTKIEGHTKDYKDTASIADELEYDRHHWVDSGEISFPIAIADAPKRPDGKMREDPQYMKDYCVTAFPTYVFIDSQGVVQYVQVGHRDDLEERFAKIIEKILPKAGTK